MVKRIIVVCEGPTEKEFCNDVLQPALNSKGIYLQTPTIKKSGGGIVSWTILKKELENHLKQDKNVLVTTFIDYYGIYEKHQFPGWLESRKVVDKVERICFLEREMKQSIDEGLRARFLPYIQLHEFEGLLFIDLAAFENNFSEHEFKNKAELIHTLQEFPNPELINDSPSNAPSYRLKRLIIGYNKVVYGPILADSIGLAAIRGKCPRFNAWVEQLESK